jgi:hypothetical protein
MNPWKHALREGAITGSVASVLSTVALAAAGRREDGHAVAPINATSHWFYDTPALGQNHPSLRHTLGGYLIHHAASMFWGVLHARAWGMHAHAKRTAPALAGAGAAAAAACFVDLRVAPRRLTPGFEHRLSSGSLVLAYAFFALGLAASSVLLRPVQPQ